MQIHSCPTRRSSDLARGPLVGRLEWRGTGSGRVRGLDSRKSRTRLTRGNSDRLPPGRVYSTPSPFRPRLDRGGCPGRGPGSVSRWYRARSRPSDTPPPRELQWVGTAHHGDTSLPAHAQAQKPRVDCTPSLVNYATLHARGTAREDTHFHPISVMRVRRFCRVPDGVLEFALPGH